MRHVTLRNRIKRLEKRCAFRRIKRTVFHTCPELGEPIAIDCHKGSIERAWGESEEALLERARAALGWPILFARYPDAPDNVFAP